MKTSVQKQSEKVRALADFKRHIAAYAIVNTIILGVTWFTLSDGGQFFTFCTFSVAFWWGITIMFHALGVFSESFSFGKKWEERKIQEYMEQQGHKTKWE